MKKPKLSFTKTVQIAILISAAVLMQLISAIQFYNARNEIKDDLEHNAEMELFIKASNIKESLSIAETAIKNHHFKTAQLLPYPDSLFTLTRQIVELNPDMIGCSICMIPDYYPEKGRLFEPYTVRRDSALVTYQLASDQHDYSQRDIFINAVEHDSSFWSEPYLDPYDPNITLVTYSTPIHGPQGKVVAMMAVDLTTSSLNSVLNSRPMFPSSYSLLLSGKGQLICGPEEKSRHQEIAQMVSMINDSTLKRVPSTTGFTKRLSFIDQEDGSKGSVYYFTPKTIRPWHIAAINYDGEVFQTLDQLRRRNLLLMLMGLLVMAFIIHRSAKIISKLQQANMEKERLNNELDIARGIQMEMLPKTFPPFPDRDDIDIYGMLEPAKTVGGDLYDFFIRDEKLYFCIGDASGKGVPAALIMSSVMTLFRSSTTHESNPKRIMHILNEYFIKNNECNMFVTMFIGVLDLPTGKMRYCNAGHNGPLVIGQEIKPLPVYANLPLGVMDHYLYKSQELVLSPEETVFLYTDGLNEAMNVKHEQFGTKRIESMLTGHLAASTKEIIEKMLDSVRHFTQEAEQSDDLTMLAVKYSPKAKEIILRQSLKLKNNVSGITQLNAFVKAANDSMHLDAGLSKKIVLAVEEAAVNIMQYAYPSDMEGELTVNIEADDTTLKFILIDSGAEFDPTTVSHADTTLSVDERPIGGLGILLVRNLMDSINYERNNGKNILTLKKNICHENHH